MRRADAAINAAVLLPACWRCLQRRRAGTIANRSGLPMHCAKGLAGCGSAGSAGRGEAVWCADRLSAAGRAQECKFRPPADVSMRRRISVRLEYERNTAAAPWGHTKHAPVLQTLVDVTVTSHSGDENPNGQRDQHEHEEHFAQGSHEMW
eukprot:CAMPEP_0119301738 /NCGR_PEP_ID=MMETSP1333-20130426/3474_1 /TAXON_ID=418940 /ORGANISM="Scyphosphaera apsteinii, Strain RCC1455" /LENGTH=149 /DNA_ID=CAMNT_0007303899 /DNA_START=1576 /DNA_END=2022 /DNA_ORIENTATION=+